MTEADIRSELRSLRKQEECAWSLKARELTALNRRTEALIKAAGMWGKTPDQYKRWLEGGTDDFVGARSALPSAATAPKPPAPVTSWQPSSPPPLGLRAAIPSALSSSISADHREPAMALRHSRAAEIAEIHLDPINDSRKRCGLDPLSSAQAEVIFAEARPQMLPLSATRPMAGSFGAKKARRREAANALMAAQGLRTDRVGIDDLHGELAARLSATLPARSSTGERRASATDGGKVAHGAVDWGSIVVNLNAENGLASPARGSR